MKKRKENEICPKKKVLRGENPADKRISQETTFQSSGIETIDAKRRRHSIFPRS